MRDSDEPPATQQRLWGLSVMKSDRGVEPPPLFRTPDSNSPDYGPSRGSSFHLDEGRSLAERFGRRVRRLRRRWGPFVCKHQRLVNFPSPRKKVPSHPDGDRGGPPDVGVGGHGE